MRKTKKELMLIVSIVFLMSILFSVNASKAYAAESGTRLNPYNAYEYHVVTLQKYSFDSVKTVGVQLMEYIDGPEANAIVAYENQFNDKPAAGEKWILIRMQFKYISSSEGDELLDANDILYATTGSLTNFYNSTGTATLKIRDTSTFSHNYRGMSQFDVSMYPGGEADVWYGMLISDSEPYITFKIPSSSKTDTWFTTNPAASSSGNQTTAPTPTPVQTVTPTPIIEVPNPELNKVKSSLYIGQSLSLKLINSNENVEWMSTNEDVATVTEQGKVKAIGKGTATIIATVGDINLECKITVKSPKISQSSLSLYLGGKQKLSVEGTTSKITWSSSNAKIAKVTSNGTVYGLKKGSVKITATIGKSKYTCKVTVKNPELSKTKLSVSVGTKKKLIVNGGTGDIKWASNNPSIAKVTKNGYVNGVKEGKAIITATINGIKLSCNVTVTPFDIKTKVSEPTNDQIPFGWQRNSVDGIKFCWTAKNTSGKTINYYTIKLYYENPVGDPAYDEITNLSYNIRKYVGPVAPGEELIIFDTIGYVPVLEKVTLGEITLEYSDGTKETGWYGYTTTNEYDL